MKTFRKLAFILILIILCLGVVACTKKSQGQVDINNSKNLTPADITKLAALTNYGNESRYYAASAVTYSDYSAEKAKLAARIEDKKADALKPDTSSIIKIFASSDAEAIILRMGIAALPAAEMTKTVNYMAGEENVTEAAIDARVETGIWSSTPNWSFFDDWSYYEKLQDRADANKATDTDKDNVKRQYRNIAGKVFAIGMTGAQFARVATHELDYTLSVVSKMAGNKAVDTPEFTTYCKDELDYDTLVYLRAFNEYYGNGTGLADCVELYGYYYDYNKKNYDTVSDEEFEKELKYSHYTTYTDAEWLEYVALQRKNYTGAYRYTDAFYTDFYSKHFSFQEKKEKWEYSVYLFSIYNDITYTQEMRNAISGDGLQGQLNMTDWLWCYSGKDDVMKAYNQANTKYENGKNGSSEAENEGKFYYEMEQLKMIDYIITNMSPLNLSGALRYQIYSYSGSMIQSISNNKKDIRLITDNRIDPTEVTSVLSNLQGGDIKDYATGKVNAIIAQIQNSYATVQPKTKANNAASVSWKSMGNEIKAALTYDYTSLASWEKKVERLEDLVIKRKYDCGVGLDDECPRGTGHAECEKVYDKEHTISQFVSNHEPILRYMGGNVAISFQQNKEATTNDPNNYKIKVWGTDLPKTYNCGYGQANPVTTEMLQGVAYFEKQEISIGRGDVFSEAILDVDKKPREWWQGTGSKPVKAESKVSEISTVNQQTGSYTYTYTFSGWYLDDKLIYKFDPSDTINCDLILYAGYNVTKK